MLYMSGIVTYLSGLIIHQSLSGSLLILKALKALDTSCEHLCTGHVSLCGQQLIALLASLQKHGIAIIHHFLRHHRPELATMRKLQWLSAVATDESLRASPSRPHPHLHTEQKHQKLVRNSKQHSKVHHVWFKRRLEAMQPIWDCSFLPSFFSNTGSCFC
jgi:hypothetical protein